MSTQKIFQTKELSNAFLKRSAIFPWEGVSYTPTNLNKAERLYYSTVGQQVNPYRNTHAHQFDATEVRKLLPGIQEPDVLNNLDFMIDAAFAKGFIDPVKLIENVMFNRTC